MTPRSLGTAVLLTALGYAVAASVLLRWMSDQIDAAVRWPESAR